MLSRLNSLTLITWTPSVMNPNILKLKEKLLPTSQTSSVCPSMLSNYAYGFAIYTSVSNLFSSSKTFLCFAGKREVFFTVIFIYYSSFSKWIITSKNINLPYKCFTWNIFHLVLILGQISSLISSLSFKSYPNALTMKLVLLLLKQTGICRFQII